MAGVVETIARKNHSILYATSTSGSFNRRSGKVRMSVRFSKEIKETAEDDRPKDQDGHAYVGLYNQAQTCYLNSLLQTLYMTPEFRNALYSYKFTQRSDSVTAASSIAYQLQRLFITLQTSEQSAVHTNALTLSFGWCAADAWYQHDIPELCHVMYAALERCLRRTPYAGLTRQLYQGEMIDSVRCERCYTVKSHETPFYELQLSVRNDETQKSHGNILTALGDFMRPEVLAGDNSYACDTCGSKTTATKMFEIIKLPKLLAVQLKRFTFNMNTMSRVKLNDRLEFNAILDLDKIFLENETGEVHQENLSFTDKETVSEYFRTHEPSSNLYELFSIMIHCGSANGGHYMAYVKDITTQSWQLFDDNNVRRVTSDDEIEKYFGGPSVDGTNANAYMLIYRKIDITSSSTQFVRHCELPAHIYSLAMEMAHEEQAEAKLLLEEQHMMNFTVRYESKDSHEENVICQVKIDDRQKVSKLITKIIEEFDLEDLEPVFFYLLNTACPIFIGPQLNPLNKISEIQTAAVFVANWNDVADPKSHTIEYEEINLSSGIKGHIRLLTITQTATVADLAARLDGRIQAAGGAVTLVQNVNETHVLLLDQPDAPIRSLMESGETLRVYVARGKVDTQNFLESRLFQLIDRDKHTVSVNIVLPSSADFRACGVPYPDYMMYRRRLSSYELYTAAEKNAKESLAKSKKLVPVKRGTEGKCSDQQEPIEDTGIQVGEVTVSTTGEYVTSLTTDSRHTLLIIRNFLAGFLGVAPTDCSLAKCQRDRVYEIRDVAKQTVDSCKHVQALVVKLGHTLAEDEMLVQVNKMNSSQLESDWQNLFTLVVKRDVTIKDMLFGPALQSLSSSGSIIQCRITLREVRPYRVPQLKSLSQRLNALTDPIIVHFHAEKSSSSAYPSATTYSTTLFARRVHIQPQIELGRIVEFNVNSMEELKHELSTALHIDQHGLMITHPLDTNAWRSSAFPYVCDAVHLLDDANELFVTVDDAGLQLADFDGKLIYVRDAEQTITLSTAARQAATKTRRQREAREHNPNVKGRKERALRIYAQSMSMSIADGNV